MLKEYAEHLPLTLRQIFYRLVATAAYEKTEAAYERLGGLLNRARRAGLVPFEAIRDDGVTVEEPNAFSGLPQFWQNVNWWAEEYRRDRLDGQEHVVELWVEAGGMVPQAARVAHEYGIAVYSAGGFDSLSGKYEAARRILKRAYPTLVLHVGDHDPSGLSIFDAAAADVAALVGDMSGGADCVRFERVAVTPEQITRYGLPEAPAKTTDRRGQWRGGTVQAEALAPDVLAAELERVIRGVLDMRLYEAVLVIEASERAELAAELARIEAAHG